MTSNNNDNNKNNINNNDSHKSVARTSTYVAPFYLGGMSTMLAATFSNPMEVIKIKMQLQGELMAPGTYSRQYSNVFQAFYKVARTEGMFFYVVTRVLCTCVVCVCEDQKE